MTKLTVGIPVYNEERFLASAIESILSQTLGDLKLVIADNASSDQSYNIARHFAAQDSRVSIIRHSQNLGALMNFRFCLDSCDTPYFVWLGAHDTFQSDYLKAAVDFLDKNNDTILAYSRAIEIDTEGRVIQAIEEDVDTTRLTIADGLVKIVRTLSSCSPFHGVFRARVLKALPIERSADHSIIFATGLYGCIHRLPIVGLHYRQVRIETYREAVARRHSGGFYPHRKYLDPHAYTILEHLGFLWQAKHLTTYKKFTITFRILLPLVRKFGGAWFYFVRQQHPRIDNAYQRLKPSRPR